MVWQPHDGHRGDAGTAFNHLFDLTGVDIIAAAYDQLLRPPANGEVAVFADGADISRGKPALFVEALLGGIGPLPVTGEDVRPAHFYLPDLPVGQRLARLDVHDSCLLARKQPAHGPRPALALERIGEVHDRLRNAVTLQNTLSKQTLEAIEGLGTQGRSRRRRDGWGADVPRALRPPARAACTWSARRKTS